MAKKRKAAIQGGSLRILRDNAKQVMAALGKGHTERVYHKAMITLLNKKGVPHRSEVLAPIYFLGEVVGVGRCDLVVKDLVVELKANAKCPKNFSAQLRKYMTSMGAVEHRKFQGIIVNFNQRTGVVEVHRGNPVVSSAASLKKKKKTASK